MEQEDKEGRHAQPGRADNRDQGPHPRGTLRACFRAEGDTGPQHVKDDAQGKGQIEKETYPTFVGYRVVRLGTLEVFHGTKTVKTSKLSKS